MQASGIKGMAKAERDAFLQLLCRSLGCKSVGTEGPSVGLAFLGYKGMQERGQADTGSRRRGRK